MSELEPDWTPLPGPLPSSEERIVRGTAAMMYRDWFLGVSTPERRLECEGRLQGRALMDGVRLENFVWERGPAEDLEYLKKFGIADGWIVTAEVAR